MPHVRVYGACTVRAHWETFSQDARRDDARIVKTLAAFLSSDGSNLLIECLAIEGYLRQTFLAQLLQKDDGILVRLYPGSTPEKTEGVRFCLGWIASKLRVQDPACRMDSGNLGVHLPPD
jgi:hypothetical protein